MRVSTVFLLASVAAAMAVTGYDYVIKPGITALVYDDRPPAVFFEARLRQTKVRSGDPIEFAFIYTKRKECHPPLIQRGALVRFRVWHNSNDYIYLRFENLGHALPSDTPIEKPYRAIPMPPLAPGNYMFQWTATYHCKGSSGPMTVESPKLPFEIEDKT